MLQCLVDLAKADDLPHWITQHEENEDGDRYHEAPHLALKEHHKETGVKESIQSCDLTHHELDHMPAIKVK